jgi:glycine cleavage system pyridoxal-binding protein P
VLQRAGNAGIAGIALRRGSYADVLASQVENMYAMDSHVTSPNSVTTVTVDTKGKSKGKKKKKKKKK